MADEPTSPADQSQAPFDWKAFSQKTWVIVIGGILFPPLGMILTWLKPGWTNRTKWIVTGLFGVLLIGRMQSTAEDSSQEESAVVSSETPGEAKPVAGASSGIVEAEKGSSRYPAGGVMSPETVTSSAESSSYKSGWSDGRRQAEDFVRNRIAGKEQSPHVWTPSLLGEVKELKRVMDIQAKSTFENSRDNSRGRYEGYMTVAESWVAVAEAEENRRAVQEEKAKRAATESTRNERVKPQQANATIPAKDMADVLKNSFALRLGMTGGELMRSLGHSPSSKKVTNPSDHAIPGLPIVDPRPFTIYTWSSAENPDNTFVMVCVKEDRVCEVSVYKNGGEILNLEATR